VEIPSDYYNPIKQDIVILTRGKHNTGAMALWQFLRGDQAKRVIKKYGYELP
jgi:molybdate transport system substrate-binding protein